MPSVTSSHGLPTIDISDKLTGGTTMKSKKHKLRGTLYRLSQLERPEPVAGRPRGIPTDHTTPIINSHSLTYHTRTQLNEALGFAKGPRKINRSGKARLVRQVVKDSETIE